MPSFSGTNGAPRLNHKAATRLGWRPCFAFSCAVLGLVGVPQAGLANGAPSAPVGPRVATPAAASPAVGVSSERLFGAWSLTCSTHKPPRCGLTQAVATDAEGKQVVLGAAVHPVPELGKLRLEFRVSQLADARAGIGMKFQDGPEYRLPMSGCTAQFCAASGLLEGPIREALENGKAAQMAFMMPGPKQALVPLALSGLKEGLIALEKASKPAPATTAPKR